MWHWHITCENARFWATSRLLSPHALTAAAAPTLPAYITHDDALSLSHTHTRACMHAYTLPGIVALQQSLVCALPLVHPAPLHHHQTIARCLNQVFCCFAWSVSSLSHIAKRHGTLLFWVFNTTNRPMEKLHLVATDSLKMFHKRPMVQYVTQLYIVILD